MRAEIRPEPSADERRALLLALARARVDEQPQAYRSPWRRAGLPAESSVWPGQATKLRSARSARRG